MAYEEAKRVIKEYEDAKQERRKRAEEEIKALEQKGWEEASYKSIPMIEIRYRFSKHHYSGWRATQTNAHTGEVVGMNYILTKENIILCTGGGTHTLQEGIIISRDEINQLNQGIVPDRIKYDTNYHY
jgi:hypothetical protein